MKIPIQEIDCPYCGVKGRHALEVTGDWAGREEWVFVNCDDEEGGCGEKFVLVLGLTPTIEVLEIKK